MWNNWKCRIADRNVKWFKDLRELLGKVFVFVSTLKTHLPCDPKAPLLGIYLRKIKIYDHEKISIRMFLRASNWKLSNVHIHEEKTV